MRNLADTPEFSKRLASGLEVASQSIEAWKEQVATLRRILIRKSYLWAGMFKDGVADIDVQIERNDGSIVAKLQWDHYADPVGPVARDDYFTPYMTLGAGESLTMTYRAVSITTPTVAHVQFVIWWTRD